MTLTLVYVNGDRKVIHTVLRMTILSDILQRPACLYYETCNHQRGYGERIPLDTLEGWEATDTIRGTDLKL